MTSRQDTNAIALDRFSRTPLEKIERICIQAMIVNHEALLSKGLTMVVLACGHYAIVRASHRARCQRCQEMLRRSLADGSEDYMAFREGGAPDQMEWEDDPCRNYNEGRI